MTRGTFVFVVLAATAGSSCSSSQAAGVRTADPPSVAVVKAVTGNLAQTLAVAAEFRPFQEIDIHAKVAGYLKSISVDVGDRVHVGERLAVLEVPELQDELRQDAAAVKRAEEDVNRAQADLERANSAHEVAHVGATRLSSVLKVRPNLVAQQDIDEAMGRDRVAEAQTATAKAGLAAAQQGLEVSKAAQQKTQTLWGYTEITAPFAGVITQRYADPGAMIQAGTSSQTQAMPVVRLSQNNRLRLVIPVPESTVALIHVGTAVDLNVQALHKTFTGKVARFSERLDSDTRTMRVEVDVENPVLELVPGMYATASIVLDSASDAVIVPVEALDHSETRPQVFVINANQKVEVRAVTTGLETSDRVQITNGISSGDLVVTGNRAQLKPGLVVTPRVMDAATPSTEAR
ncbi:MAG TPA: efflux RND transporter periplasmic adaptor subunit [Vicinamibacterales bacterium]